MGAAVKHGGHRGTRTFAAGTIVPLFVYDGETLNEGTYDWSPEQLVSVVAVFGTGFSGLSAASPTIAIVQQDKAGTLKNLVTKTFGAGVDATAWVPIDITNAVAGTGGALPWTLVPGDVVIASTSAITSQVGVTWRVGSLGS